MNAKKILRVIVVHHLLIYLCLGDNQYWIVQQLKPDKSCTKNCAGRRVRKKCSENDCTLMEEFINCNYPTICSSDITEDTSKRTECTGECNHGTYKIVGTCSNDPKCVIYQTKPCLITEDCTSQWTSWRSIEDKCNLGNCKGWKLATRTCVNNRGTATLKCFGVGTKAVQKVNITCGEYRNCDKESTNFPDIARSLKPYCYCNDLELTTMKACQRHQKSQVSYTMNCKSKSSYEVIYNNNNKNTVLHWSNWRPFKNVTFRSTETDNDCNIEVQVNCQQKQDQKLNIWMVISISIAGFFLIILILIFLTKKLRPQKMKKNKSIEKQNQNSYSNFEPAGISFVVTSAEGNEIHRDSFKNVPLLNRSRCPTPRKKDFESCTEYEDAEQHQPIHKKNSDSIHYKAPQIHYKSPKNFLEASRHDQNVPRYDQVPTGDSFNDVYSLVASQETNQGYLKPNKCNEKAKSSKNCIQKNSQYMEMSIRSRGTERRETLEKERLATSYYKSLSSDYLTTEEIQTATEDRMASLPRAKLSVRPNQNTSYVSLESSQKLHL